MTVGREVRNVGNLVWEYERGRSYWWAPLDCLRAERFVNCCVHACWTVSGEVHRGWTMSEEVRRGWLRAWRFIEVVISW